MAEKRRKPAAKMTSDEIAAHVFPPKLHRHLKRAANPATQLSTDHPQADADPTRQRPRKSS